MAQPHAADVLRRELDEQGVTLWRQLKRMLRDEALAHLQPGDRLATEEEIGRLYGVSRTTVRQAIASLVAEGVLFTRQGSGTFVAPRKLAHEVGGLAGLARTDEQIVRSGMRPGARVLSVERIEPDERLKRQLAVTDGEPIHKVRRLRLADDIPVATQVTYLSARLFPDLDEAAFANSSLRDLLAVRFGLQFSHLEATIESVTADDYRAELLSIPPGSALLLIERTTFSAAGVPVIFSRLFYRSDRYQLHLRVDLPEAEPSSPPRQRE